MPDIVKQYRDYLVTKGIDAAPNLESFKKTLSDEGTAKQYYDYLIGLKSSKGLDVPDSFESFAGTLGVKKKSPSTQNLESSSPESGSQSTSTSTTVEPPKKLTYGDIENLYKDVDNRAIRLKNMQSPQSFTAGTGGAIPAYSTQSEIDLASKELNFAKDRKDAAIRNYSKEIARPVDKLFETGEYKNYFENGVFDRTKARNYFDQITQQYGGGDYLKDVWMSDLNRKGQLELNKPRLAELQKEEMKSAGVDMDKWGNQVVGKLAQSKLAEIDDIKADIKNEGAFALDKAKQTVDQYTTSFNAIVNGLNDKIKTGAITADQAANIYETELAKYNASVKKQNDDYLEAIRTINIKAQQRYSKVKKDVDSLGSSVTFDSILAEMPEEERKKIEVATTKAFDRLSTEKDDVKRAMIKAEAGSPFATEWGSIASRAVMSGVNSGLAMVGDALHMNGINNGLTDWMRDRKTAAEQWSTPQYEWNKKEWWKRAIASSGSSLGVSAVTLLPTIGAAALTKSPVAGTLASGTLGFLGENAQIAGDEYAKQLDATGDPNKARDKAVDLFKKNTITLPFYFVGGLGDMFLLKGKGLGKMAAGFGLEQVEEVPTEYIQSYNEAKNSGYKGTFGKFVKENPSIAADVVLSTIGQSSAMSTIGQSFSAFSKTAPSVNVQYYTDAINKGGVDFAKKIAENFYTKGVINKEEYQTHLNDITNIATKMNKLADLGVEGDKAKLMTSLSDKANDLKLAIQTEQDDAVKAIHKEELTSLEEDIKNLTKDQTPYVVFTLPGDQGASRVMTVREYNKVNGTEEGNNMIKAANTIEVVNDDELKKQLNEIKIQLGNLDNAPDGLYTNGIADKKALRETLKAKFGLTDTDFKAEPFTEEEDTADRAALPKSDFTNEQELEDALKTGEFAMLTGMNPEKQQMSKSANKVLNDKAQKWLADRGLKPVAIYGKYDNSERSFFVPNMTKEQSIEFAKEFNQDSVAHSSGLVYQDGSFNPRTGEVGVGPKFGQEGANYFSSINIDGKPVDFSVGYDFDTKYSSDGKLIEGKETGIDQRLSNAIIGDIDSKVTSAQKALEATGVKINMIDNTADFEKAVSERKGPEGIEGVFISDTGEILINKELLAKGIADGRVIWHEASHPVINIIRNTNSNLFNQVIAGMQEAAKTDKNVAAVLNWAKENYGTDGEGVVNDEAVVEMIANLAEGTIDISNMPTGFKQAVIDIINKIAQALGFKPVLSDTDVAAFKKLVTDISDALATGRDISEIVGEENVKEYLNTVEAPGIVTGGEFSPATQARVTTDPAISVYDYKEVSSLPQKSLEEIYNKFGGKAVVINSDPTRVGELTLPSGKKIFMYGGPAYLSIKDNVDANIGFATTKASKVKTWMNYVKEVFGDKPGVTFIATQAPTSILSNSYALRYVMDAISMLPKSVLRSSDFKNEFFGKDLVLLKDAFGGKAYNEFVNKYKKADLSNPKVIDDMIAEMGYKVGDDNKPASFKARGAFVSNLVGGITDKASIKGVEGDKGYVSKKPKKYIAKQLMDRLGINTEKIMREIGEPSLVDLYMNEGNWGFAVAGFETDPSMTIESVQKGGVKHPLFNAKFPGKNQFILDGAYELNKMFTPIETTGPSGKPYTKTAKQMLAGSMYVKGQPLSEGGSFEYTPTPIAGSRIQASKGKRESLILDAGLDKKMTSDDKGNYLFYHYSDKKLKSIDPNKFGKNLATGRDERPGIGISMYYTRPDQLETGVPSDNGYVVRVAEDKVYPFNQDPLDLLPEAKKAFEKQYPGQAFDFNKQVAFVTKVAADRGYPMTVAEWNIGGRKALRAQTTESMKPEKYSNIVPGTMNQVEYNPELEKFKPNAKRRQASVGRRDVDTKLKQFVENERAIGTSDQDIERAIKNRFPSIEQSRVDAIMSKPTVIKPTIEEKAATIVEATGKEKTRGMEKRFGELDENTYKKIEDDAKTYFTQTNKQTEDAANEFMNGRSVEDMAKYVVSNPNIPGAVNVWMAASTAKNLGKEIEAAKQAGDVNRVEELSTLRANIYNHFAAKATDLGQTIQAFVSFKDDPAANQFMLNKILKQLEDKGVAHVTDEQLNDIKSLLDEVSTAPAGLPKDIAITKLSHYLAKIAPIKAFDILQAIWYAKILSGITTQSKNFFANVINTFVETPVVGLRMSLQTGSLQPMFYALKGLGGGTIKGLVKAGDILKSGVTSKSEDKFFNNDNLLEYFSWADTKLGKTFGGLTGKILDFPLFFEISPKALKFVGRALTASDAIFSTANQEAMANMMAFAQAKKEGKEGITANTYKRAQEILGNTKETIDNAKKQAIEEGFDPNTIQYKRRVIEIVNLSRGQEIVQRSEEIGKRATLTNEPEGFTRGIYLAATNFQKSLPASKVVIPFTRIVANMSEMLINYSPAGMYRAVTGIKNPNLNFNFNPQGDNKLRTDERADLFIKSMIGITALTLLSSKTGDDEDDWFDITAAGPADFGKKYELMKGGWRPYTITLKDGTKINYAEWPIAGALSAIGTIHDVDRYGDPEKEENRLVIGAGGYTAAIYDKSLLKGISDFVEIFNPKGKFGQDAKIGERISKFSAQQVKSVLQSNFSQQGLKLVDEYKDNPIKEAKGAEALYRDIPVLNDGLNPIIDVFGDEVTYATTERLLPWMSVSDDKKDEILAYLNRNNVFVGVANERPMIDLNTATERKMTRDELYTYRKNAGKYTKQFLYDNISLLKDLNGMEDGKKLMKEAVAGFASAARDMAYAEMITQ